MKLRINADDGLKHRYAVTQKELLDERIITQQLRENTAELPGIKAAQEVGLGGYCSPRHMVPCDCAYGTRLRGVSSWSLQLGSLCWGSKWGIY
jgi:hypothetical protein